MIKYLIAILLTTTAAYSQTIKTLGYNTTNGQVSYSGSNTLTFTNTLGFSNAAATRSNLGLGASWLTNSNSPATTNATNLTAGTLPDARLSTNVAILSNLPSWATTTNADVARTNLGIGWSALTNTDATNFRNSIGLGTNQNVTFADITGTRLQVGGVNVTTSGFNGPITLSVGQSISFISGGSPDQTRTNLGLGAGWLTNTNVTNFRSAIGLTLSALTNTNVTNFRTDIGLGSLATNNTVPSGAAASNSILTADGAGSSSFVASKTTYLRSTNIVFSNSIIPTNITGMSWVVSANKTYMVSATAIIDQQAGGYDVRIQWPSALAYTNATNTSGSGVAMLGSGAFTPVWTTNTNNLRLFTRGGAVLPQQATAFVMVTIGTNGGTANFQVCQQSSNATATTITSLTAIIQEL